MLFMTVLASVGLSIFSTAVMGYIAMATPIGPWIAPTLVLFAMLLFKFFRDKSKIQEQVALSVSAGSIGGILATAMGFSFPTLYFLDRTLFNQWMASPFYFMAVLAGLAFFAGWFGIWIAGLVEQKFIVEEPLSFPIGQLVHKMIAAQQQVRKSWELLIGFAGTFIFCSLQDGFWFIKSIIPKSFILRQASRLVVPFGSAVVKIPAIQLDLWPMLWAIGFVTGHIIAFPLAVGALSKMFIVGPVNSALFAHIPSMEFVLAFCSGMVLAGAVFGFIGAPKTLMRAISSFKEKMKGSGKGSSFLRNNKAETVLLLGSLIAFLSYFGFSPITQFYLLAFTFVCTYQIVLIAGKIGLAQLGRFATFVMVPAMFIFDLNLVQIVLIATFVELCGGVAVDVLFSRKMAHLANISSQKIKRYQFLGLAISSLVVGLVFWLLISQFGLGSAALFAQRAQARQLLIDAKSFDYAVLFIGFIFGILLKMINTRIKRVPSLRAFDVNPMMVLSGLLMPLNVSLGLIVGGLFALFAKNKEEYYPFWSGVFASNSIWMLIRTLL